MRTGVYAGSFDPITRGHIDIIKRALTLVDHLHVSIGMNVSKKRLFTPAGAADQIRIALRDELGSEAYRPVTVDTFSGLLVSHAEKIGATHVFRGLRAAPDFNAEFEIHGVMHILNPNLQVVYLMALPDFLYVSSSRVKEIVSMGGDASRFVTPNVLDDLKAQFMRF